MSHPASVPSRRSTEWSTQPTTGRAAPIPAAPRAQLRIAVLVAGLFLLNPGLAAEDKGAADIPALVRIGIGAGTWGDVNHHDARAAITAWARTILAQRRPLVEVEAQVFETPEALQVALKAGTIDAVSMLTDQFLDLEPALQPGEVFLATRSHSFTEKYVLVVHQRGGIRDVADLRGRTILLPTGHRNSLATPWLRSSPCSSRL